LATTAGYFPLAAVFPLLLTESFLAAAVFGLTSSDDSSLSSSLLDALTIYLPTGFFYTTAAFVAGFFLVSSSEDSSELSSLDTAGFFPTTAFCFSSFLGYLDAAPFALAFDSTLPLLAPTN